MASDEPTACFDLDHYRADVRALDAEGFAAKHGRAFLVLSKDSEAGLQLVEGPRKTMAGGLRADMDTWRPEEFRIWPVRKTTRSLIARNISVGRTRTNDVVIPDVSLSKFHAFFRKEGDVLNLQDAGSRNGTFVDGKRVKKQGDGPAVTLSSGSHVRFGSVELLLLDAAALRRLVLELIDDE